MGVRLSNDELLVLRIVTDTYDAVPPPKIVADDARASELTKLSAVIALRHVKETMRDLGIEEPDADDKFGVAIARLADQMTIASLIGPHVRDRAIATMGCVASAHTDKRRPIVVEEDGEPEDADNATDAETTS